VNLLSKILIYRQTLQIFLQSGIIPFTARGASEEEAKAKAKEAKAKEEKAKANSIRERARARAEAEEARKKAEGFEESKPVVSLSKPVSKSNTRIDSYGNIWDRSFNPDTNRYIWIQRKKSTGGGGSTKKRRKKTYNRKRHLKKTRRI